MIKVLKYQESINASADKVYRTMLGLDNPKTYAEWTYEFNPTSQVRGNWEKGSKMYFVGTDEDGKEGGMVSVIAENTPAKFVSIKHIGMLDGTSEITEGPEVESWAGAMENYSFEEKNGQTIVSVETGSTEDHIDYFDEAWPKALTKLKEMCEKN